MFTTGTIFFTERSNAGNASSNSVRQPMLVVVVQALDVPDRGRCDLSMLRLVDSVGKVDYFSRSTRAHCECCLTGTIFFLVLPFESIDGTY